MNLEKQVVNLELSKKLHELGVKQESLFYWINGDIMSNEEFLNMSPSEKIIFNYNTKECYSAFTASELMEMLPHEVLFHGIRYAYLYILKKNHEYEIRYDSSRLDDIKYIEFDFYIQDALAKMLIHLIENKIIEV